MELCNAQPGDGIQRLITQRLALKKGGGVAENAAPFFINESCLITPFYNGVPNANTTIISSFPLILNLLRLSLLTYLCYNLLIDAILFCSLKLKKLQDEKMYTNCYNGCFRHNYTSTGNTT